MNLNPSERLQALIDDFALFEDWEDRYRYLIDLGRTLPVMAESLKTDAHIVRGCTSRVWMDSAVDKNGWFHFTADSDAHIVRGLIAVLDRAYQGIPVSEIAQVDIAGAFAHMGLEQNLSPSRRNGFYAMVERIRASGAQSCHSEV